MQLSPTKTQVLEALLKHQTAEEATTSWGRKAERKRALELFQRAARLGSAAAMVDAGLMCWEEGRCDEAVGYYQKAAELGHPVGMCNLGVSYLEGERPSGFVILAIIFFFVSRNCN
ncbi:hypothetical protein E2562_020225 [Oryza meyeriana var. granulata]|uniref:Uncharacterized protein n=1 Tax=Oryza meyeriana var. granulata TaxID=110450 RepID=A0A6G1DLJ0_9ORYZ|nr:hypothetical protein E2562_020225 [Oryza meyeriana var. granulata]